MIQLTLIALYIDIEVMAQKIIIYVGFVSNGEWIDKGMVYRVS